MGDTADIKGGENEKSVAAGQLKAFIERIERMEDEKKAIVEDIREIYAEAKGNGFDTKVMREIVRARAKDRNELLEALAIKQLYAEALGMGGIFG